MCGGSNGNFLFVSLKLPKRRIAAIKAPLSYEPPLENAFQFVFVDSVQDQAATAFSASDHQYVTIPASVGKDEGLHLDTVKTIPSKAVLSEPQKLLIKRCKSLPLLD